MKGKTRFAVIAAVVVGLLALGIGGTVVLAQGPTTTPTAPGTGTTPAAPGATSPAPSGATTPANTGASLQQLFWQALATRLGTTVDKLQAAITGAESDAVNQAIKQGVITQNQAAPFLQRTVSVQVEQAALDAAAKTLGMSTADLTTAMRNGQTLLQVMQSKNGDATKLRTAMADAEKAAIDQAVKDGKLTQAQADTMKARITPDNINLNRRYILPQQGQGLGGLFGGMFGKGHGVGRGQHRGGMMGPNGQNQMPGGMMGPNGQNQMPGGMMGPNGQNQMPGGMMGPNGGQNRGQGGFR